LRVWFGRSGIAETSLRFRSMARSLDSSKRARL
jgi:hypothetical protein